MMKHIAIIGGGFAGLLLAHLLSKSNFRISIFEKGKLIKKSRQELHKMLINGQNPFIESEKKIQELINESKLYNPDLYRISTLGGTWEIACGNAIRLDIDDFRMKEKFSIGNNWAISYNDLEPYYSKAETIMGVAGDEKQNYSKRWRSSSFPLPAFPFSQSDKILIQGCEKLGIAVYPMPQARNSIDYQNASLCKGSNTCFPYCPTGAKFSVLHRFFQDFNKSENINTHLRSLVSSIQCDDKQAVINYVNEKKENCKLSADICILASGAIENAKILLNSTSKKHKNGLGNSTKLVGKFFMEHPQTSVHGFSRNEVKFERNHPLQTARIDNFADYEKFGTSRFVLEFNNHGIDNKYYIPSQKILNEFKNINLSERYVRISGLVEQFPNEKNRVYLSKTQKDYYGMPIPIFQYTTNRACRIALKSAINKILEIHKAAEIITDCDSLNNIGFSGHQMGTTIMGETIQSGVVNSNCQLFECDNIFIAGSSVFPTSGVSNPTLTIAALCIRLSEFITKKYE